MEDKIYEKIRKEDAKNAEKYLKIMNIIDEDDEVNAGEPKKNLDLCIILSNLGLIEPTPETMKTITDFHDYLFKLGINIGVGEGKKIIITGIKKDQKIFDELMEINPEDYVKNESLPTFIQDMKEVIINEK